MPTNVLAEISKSRGSLQTERCALEWINTFAELFSVELDRKGKRFVDLWGSALADLEPTALDAACRRAMQTCKFFPMPAEIRAHLDAANENAFELEAEHAWERLHAWVRENVFPDTGIRRGAPELEPAVEHAATAAGGVYYLERCPDRELTFARKTFLAAFRNVRETGAVRHLLGDREAKRILARLSANSTGKQLTAAGTTAENASKFQTPEGVRAVLERVTAQKPGTQSEITDEEWEARKRRHKRAVQEYAESHGIEQAGDHEKAELETEACAALAVDR